MQIKNVIFIIPPKDFRDAELLEPKQILEQAGVGITIASKTTGTIIGADGAKVTSNLTVEEVNQNDYDAIAFIGGPGMVDFIDDEQFINLAIKFNAAKKIVSAICVAPMILANANLLAGKEAASTSWDTIPKDMENKGAIWTNDSVVSDGNIITANGPKAASEFGQVLLSKLTS